MRIAFGVAPKWSKSVMERTRARFWPIAVDVLWFCCLKEQIDLVAVHYKCAFYGT